MQCSGVLDGVNHVGFPFGPSCTKLAFRALQSGKVWLHILDSSFNEAIVVHHEHVARVDAHRQSWCVLLSMLE